MGTQGKIVTYEDLILLYFQKMFPDSPEFVDYLADRTIAFGCSLHFARILSDSLKRYFPSSKVSGECVRRLAVDADPEAVGFVNRANPFGPHAIAIYVMYFLQRISGNVRLRKRSVSMETGKMVFHPLIQTSFAQKIQYVRLFSCALAMLCGVQIDPRKPRGVYTQEISHVA